MDTMEPYRRAQDTFDAVLAAVPGTGWDRPSACTEWTVRDVAGHVIWGQRQLRAWATGAELTDQTGAPGAPHPAPLAGDDPVTTWRAARAEALATLNEETLTRITTIPGLGDVPVSTLLTLLTTDHLAHTWDIGHALGVDVRFDEALIHGSFAWARANVVRRPGFFGPELDPPADTDEQTALLAFLGRAAWQPVPA
ncbi:TIGR03086 family metal-binding protein [Actinophytocola sp.]|uniref:TIGR03086 family metal-binding protein n=1 Tax=Actinophytocola sp. TaxID=1872138 RepID=UPI003D6A1CE6